MRRTRAVINGSKHMTLRCTVCTVRGIRYEVDMIPHWPIKCPICHNKLEEEPEVNYCDSYHYGEDE